MLMPSFVNDGHYFSQNFLGYGGHFSGDVHPHWFGLSPKDDFQFSAIIGDGIGPYSSGGLATAFQLASNFSVNTSCATPTPTCTGLAAASNILVKPIFAYSMTGGYVHWWLPNLRTPDSRRQLASKPSPRSSSGRPSPTRRTSSCGTPSSPWCGTRSRSSPPASSTCMAGASSCRTPMAPNKRSSTSGGWLSRKEPTPDFDARRRGQLIFIRTSSR